MSANGCDGGFPAVIELNVGGVFYTTTLATLTKEGESLLANWFTGQESALPRDAKGRYFIDRDGVLFRYVLDFLRNDSLALPESFHEKERLKQEATFYQLPGLVSSLESPSLLSGTHRNGYITIGYRGSFAFGRDGLADVNFRKLSRILVCGRVTLCRDVFGETLNESRDPDRGTFSDRYTARYFLKHTFLEQAFDMLQEAGFRCIASCGSGTAGVAAELKPGQESEEVRWNHYNEFVFYRE